MNAAHHPSMNTAHIYSQRPCASVLLRVCFVFTAAFAFIYAYGHSLDPTPPGRVTSANQAGLEAALASGAPVTFGFDGTILLTNSITIEKDTVIDATGRSIRLDGGGKVRHFVVSQGATLRLINLTLENGRHVVGDGSPNNVGLPGLGGSIYNSGGQLDLRLCRFINNHAVGANGYAGDAPDPFVPPQTHGGPAFGGAIYSTNGQVRAELCWFENNDASGGVGGIGAGITAIYYDAGTAYGGALFATNSQVDLRHVTFTNNAALAGAKMAAGFGGALAGFGGAVAITDAAFAGNKAEGGGLRGVAGMFYSGVSGAGNGGAIYHTLGSMMISRTLFQSNRAEGGPTTSHGLNPPIHTSGHGGAVFNDGEIEIRDSSFVLNTAKGYDAEPPFAIGRIEYGGAAFGGALDNRRALIMVNCTLASNAARGGTSSPRDDQLAGGQEAAGGAIYNSGGSASLLNVTVANNQAVPGESGAPAFGSSIAVASGSVAITNTILLVEASMTNIWGTIVDGGHNISSDGSAGFTATGSRNNTDPLLGPLADNGGPAPTMALLRGSPAIDSADGSVCPAYDQRGVSRPQGLRCDIGAFEFQPAFQIYYDPFRSVRIEHRSLPERRHRIFVSTDLTEWEPLGEAVSDGNGVSRFEDADSAGKDWQFYKVQLIEN
jgi:hypothetical protein